MFLIANDRKSVPCLMRNAYLKSCLCSVSGTRCSVYGIRPSRAQVFSVKKNDQVKLGKSIEQYLGIRGWSITRLSKESGVSKSTIHAWIQGRKAINLENLKKVAASLQISVHQLVYGEPDPFEKVGQEILREIFSGDVRVTLHRIERKK